MKTYQTSAPGFPVRGNGRPVPMHPEGDATASPAPAATPAAGEAKPSTPTPPSAPATAQPAADKAPEKGEKPTEKVDASQPKTDPELEEFRREREAFRKEAQAFKEFRERDLAAQRRAHVRGFGLAVPLSDEHLDKILPPDADPATTAGAAALAEFRKANAVLFRPASEAPIADPTKVVEDIVGKENLGRQIFGARAVESMLTDRPRSGWLD